MSGLNLIPVQENILSYVSSQFPNYDVVEDMLLDDEYVLKNNNRVKPYIVLRWGGLWRLGSKSFTSVRNDEYVSTVDIAVVAPTPKQARRGLNAVMDVLIGWQPTNAGVMIPEGSNTLLDIPNNQGRPSVFIASTRLSYAVNTTDIGDYIAH